MAIELINTKGKLVLNIVMGKSDRDILLSKPVLYTR